MSYKEVDRQELRTLAVEVRQQFIRFAQEFENESERHMVILGSAKLEDLLLHLLKRHLLPIESTRDELFSGQGAPLSTFSGRSVMAFRLGLISKSFLDALNTVRTIRNAFAHKFEMSLAMDGHDQRITELRKGIKDAPAYERLTATYFRGEETPRRQLQIVLSIMILRLTGAVAKVQRIPDPKPVDLLPKDWDAAMAKGEAVKQALEEEAAQSGSEGF